MKKIILLISIILMSCGVKPSLSRSPVDVDATILVSYDSLINTTLEEIKTDSTSDILKDKILKLTEALSVCERDGTLYYTLLQQKPVTIVDKSKTKIKKSYNEDTKLKNSIFIKDSKIDSLNLENVALNGRIRDLEKSKIVKSTTGENSPNIAKSGNTTKKAEWYLWLIVFIAGGITTLGARAAITKTI